MSPDTSATQAFWLTPTLAEIELYDLTTDPLTKHSLADSPARPTPSASCDPSWTSSSAPEK